ncbi:hypothetical protein UCRNP2_2622 [Neofusicoccum parvum UCRNP2]|uniref:Involucrin repeat protein n=1 Tax=Botryosphaeria parva (strain UCR-NP2) TaxID=1287680 RepID=R1ESR0_BOTPV|nr:hypothetical protein UCRNP2_2622 [Neofusicoccum parvum UCRNP2]
MGGEPDNDAIEEARLAAEAEERQRELEQDGPSTPTRPALLSRTSSKKSKKAKKKAEKLGTVSPPEGGEATELSREEVREKTRRDTEEAIEGWFVDEPAEAAPPLQEELPTKKDDEKAESVAVAAEVPSVLLERKGSKKKVKKGKKSKSGSVSELVTPTEVSAESSGEVAVPETTQSQGPERAVEMAAQPPLPDLSDVARQREAEPASTTEQTVERAPVTFEEDATPQVAESALETAQEPVSVIPEADPEAEFAPVTSSKKKKKGKKGKSGSTSEVVAPAEPAAPVVEEAPIDVGPEVENRAGLEATVSEHVQSKDADREIEMDTQHAPPSDEVGKSFTAQPSTEPITTLEEDTTPRTITEQTPVFKGETMQEPAPLITDADPEAEFAPVVSSKKKKKGKKGKKSGSGSGSGFATPVEEVVAPVETVDEAKSVEPAITHEVDQPAGSSFLEDSQNVLAPENFVDTHDFETPTAKETADIETPTVVATDVPVVPVVDELGVHGVLEEGADVGTVQPADHQEQQPAHQPFIDPSTNLEEPATVSEEPASLGLTSVEPPTETPEADPEAEFVAVPAKKKKKGKKGRKSVAESPPDESIPDVSNATATSREIEERPAITEIPTEVVSGQPVVADTPAHIVPEVSTIAEQDHSSLPAAVPLSNLEDDLDLAQPEAEEHFDVPKQTDVPEQFVAPEQTDAKTLEADPEDEFSVVPSKKKKKSKGKNKQQQDEFASETTAPMPVEEVQEKHHVTADAVPLLEGHDGNLVEQDASAAVPMAEDERQEFKEAEEAMKIEPEAFVQEKEELATDKAPESVLPAAASETVPELSNEPQSPVARDEVREPSVALPEETITTATVPDAQPEEDTWAFQPKKKKGKKGKKAKSGQSSVDFTEPSTPTEPIAAAPELSRDAGVLETTDFSSAPEVPSAEAMETALSTGELPETTMASMGYPAGEKVEKEMPVAEILPNQDRSTMEEPTNTEEPTPIPHLEPTEDVMPNLLADPTAAVSEENPSNPAANESREETPPYAGEWELPTQKKKAGKKGKKRGGSTGQDHLQVEEGVPTDAQIANSASLFPDDAAVVPVPDVVDAADARTEDPVASSAHHRPLTPPPQSALAEDTPASGLEHSLEQQREEPLQIAEQPLVEEQQVEQQVEQPVATETAVAEDESSFMPPKKNKKGKKGKKQDSTSSTPKEIEQVPETIVDPTTDSHAVESVEPELPQVETPAEELAIASTGLADPIAPAEAGEDEWAMPVKKKKGKKGKKGFADVVEEAVQAKEPSTIPFAQHMPEHPLESDVKIDDDNTSKSLDVPDVPGQEVSQGLSEDQPVGAAEAMDVVVPIPEESSSREVPEAGQVTETVSVNDVAEEKASIEPIPEQAKEADVDDIWAAPTTKKSKKKKGKQMSVEEPWTPVETIEPAVAGEEVSAPPVEGSREIDPVVEAPAEIVSEMQPEIVSESQPEPGFETAPADAGEANAEDEWAAATSSKKKKKKGKKGKQDSISETPPNEERKVDEEQAPETEHQLDVEPVAGELVERTVDEVPVLDEPVETTVVEEPASAPVVEEARSIEEPTGTPIVTEPVVTEVPSVDTPQEAGEDEWALPAKKKKKGKKGKQASIPSTPPVIEEPVPIVEEPAPATEEPVPKVEDTQDDKLQLTEEPKSLGDSEELKDIPTAVELVKEESSLPIESEAQRNVEETPTITEPAAVEIPVSENVPAVQQAPEEAKPDDTWEAFSSKKKGKKGKKGKQQSISTPPIEVSEMQQELDPANGTQRELSVEDTPKEEQIAPTEADPTEEFSMPVSKKDKKKKKKAAAAAAQLDDTPVAETSSPTDETPAQATPIVEDAPRPEAEREHSKPAFSFADAAGVLAAGVADSRGKEAEPEGLSATPISSLKIDNGGAKDEEVLRPDHTAVETELPGVPKEPPFDSAAGDVAVPETVVQNASITDSAKDIPAPGSTELTREFPESKGKSTASVPKSLGFAAAGGILADIVAEDRRKESSSEGLRSHEPEFATPKEDIPSSLDMTATDSVRPDPVQNTSTTETPASQDKDIPATTQEISTEQPISDVPVESTATIPVETPGDADTTPLEASQAPEETDPFSEFAPVKKGKKNKKKGRKSVGTATPTTEEPVPELKEVTTEPTIEADAAPVAEEIVADDKPIESDAHPQEQTKETVELASTADEKRSESPSHDVEFAAALAAGLQDSGFDPNLVLKDPTFHERKSPPGSVLEADPDDVFAPAKSKKNKKKKKGLATPDVEGESSEIVTPEPGSVEATSQDPTFAAAMSSVLDDPTFNRRTPSPDAAKEAVSDEFFPFQKRPKKKKGKKNQDISPDSETVEQTLSEGIEEPTPIMDTPQEAAGGSYFDPQPTTSMEEPVSTTEQTPMEIDVPRDITAEDSQPPQEEEDAWSFG